MIWPLDFNKTYIFEKLLPRPSERYIIRLDLVISAFSIVFTKDVILTSYFIFAIFKWKSVYLLQGYITIQFPGWFIKLL